MIFFREQKRTRNRMRKPRIEYPISNKKFSMVKDTHLPAKAVLLSRGESIKEEIFSVYSVRSVVIVRFVSFVCC